MVSISPGEILLQEVPGLAWGSKPALAVKKIYLGFRVVRIINGVL
jgi:hypothetical protein